MLSLTRETSSFRRGLAVARAGGSPQVRRDRDAAPVADVRRSAETRQDAPVTVGGHSAMDRSSASLIAHTSAKVSARPQPSAAGARRRASTVNEPCRSRYARDPTERGAGRRHPAIGAVSSRFRPPRRYTPGASEASRPSNRNTSASRSERLVQARHGTRSRGPQRPLRQPRQPERVGDGSRPPPVALEQRQGQIAERRPERRRRPRASPFVRVVVHDDGVAAAQPDERTGAVQLAARQLGTSRQARAAAAVASASASSSGTASRSGAASPRRGRTKRAQRGCATPPARGAVASPTQSATAASGPCLTSARKPTPTSGRVKSSGSPATTTQRSSGSTAEPEDGSALWLRRAALARSRAPWRSSSEAPRPTRSQAAVRASTSAGASPSSAPRARPKAAAAPRSPTRVATPRPTRRAERPSR